MEDEELEILLGRMDIPIDAQEDVKLLKDYLTDFFGYEPTDAQYTAVQRGVEGTTTLEEHGIKGINITYPWGIERRYGVQGLPGLWGWERVQEIRAGEEW